LAEVLRSRASRFMFSRVTLTSIAVFLGAALASVAGAAEGPVSASAAASPASIHVGESATVTIELDIAEGWHINSNEPGIDFLIPTSVEFDLSDGLSVVDVAYPKPVVRQLKLGGSRPLRLYEGRVRISARLHYDRMSVSPRTPVAVVRYQACNDTLCLRPTSVRLPIQLKLSALDAREVERAGFNEEAAESIARLVAGGLWVVVPGMLLLGLALNLTPCVYPLVSVTIAYFGRQAGERRGRMLWLAICYTIGIAVTFSALGASAALSGGLFGRALTHPAVLIAISLMMVALALSSFGLYQIQVPGGLDARIAGAASGAVGATLMGMTMGLVAAPCVGPVVVGLLVFVGSRGDVLLGFSLFFLLALGLGIPYVALAMAAGSISALPRSGAWLQWTEHLFGCILLAMAIYFVRPVLPAALGDRLMPAFLFLAVAYLAFLDPAGRGTTWFVRFRAVAGIVALAALVVAYRPTVGDSEEGLPFEPFSAITYDAARDRHQPFVIEFRADWCLPC
ncbi:MAG: hypothetical protein D6760_10765, partial [Deltaproteobacteria bacterium]